MQGKYMWLRKCLLTMHQLIVCSGAGLRVLNANDVHTLKNSLEQVAIKVDNDPDVFQSFYQFAFKFCLTVSAAAPVHFLA